jgi:hypothetical protein
MNNVGAETLEIKVSLIKECLEQHEYQKYYTAFLLGQYTEVEFVEISKQFTKHLDKFPPDDPFEQLEIELQKWNGQDA